MLVFAYPLDRGLSYLLTQNHEAPAEYEVWNDIYSQQLRTEIAIYGSSRAEMHFNSLLIEQLTGKLTYNFGMNGNHFFGQHLRHQEFLNHNPAPSFIIYSVDSYTLAQNQGLYLYQQYLPYMLWNQTIKATVQQYHLFANLDYYIPLIRYIGQQQAISQAFRQLIHRDTVKYRTKGFATKDLAWNDDLEQARTKQKELVLPIDTVAVRKFNDFLKTCHQANIKVVLVYAPEQKEGQEYIRNRKEVIQTFEHISQQQNVPFIDFSNDSLCYDKKWFFNSLHLNKKGADMFTRKLIKVLQERKLIDESR
jgi:hypothetical protein